MISVSTRIDRGGFWYLIDAAGDSQFTLSYIVIGTGGRQGSGEIEGTVSDSSDWRHVEVAFPVLHVGITDLRVTSNSPHQEMDQDYRLRAEQLSRRKSIKTIAGVLLAGWAALLFPLGVAHAHDRRLRSLISPAVDPDESFNPYSDRFNPYSADSNEFFKAS